jgi:hypothetical protein
MKNKPIVIYDLDSCVSDDRWRLHLLPDYDTYHFFCVNDVPVNKEIWPKDLEEFTPIIMTARPEKFRTHTETWLKQNGFLYVELYMRENDDMRTSPEIKREMVIKKLNKDYMKPKIELAYDDRDDVLEAYRKLGIKTQKVEIK